MSVKIYSLFPDGVGYSNNTVDYHGESWKVAAVSNRQAHYYATNSIWAGGPGEGGVVEVYRRGWGEPGDHRLWCGCRIYGGIGIEHGDDVRKIKGAMVEHDCG